MIQILQRNLSGIHNVIYDKWELFKTLHNNIT